MKLFPKKLCKRNKICNYTLFHSGEKSFLTESFYFNLKCFLTSSAYRRYFKDLFHKSVRAFLGLIGEAHITLSKAIALIQSFLPQFSSWSACNWLISYLNASFTPMKTCESHLCWLTSYSFLHKRTEGNFTIGRTMATVPVRPVAAPACTVYSPTRALPCSSWEDQPSHWGSFALNDLVCPADQRQIRHTGSSHWTEKGPGITTKSLFSYDLGGKETPGIFSEVIKSRKHKT